VTAEEMDEFERRFAIPFEGQKRLVQGLDLAYSKKRQVLEILHLLRMADSRHGLFLVGHPANGRTFVLERIVEEVENFQKTGSPLTKDQDYWPHISALAETFPLSVPQKIGVYDFRNHKLMELNFQDPTVGLGFTDDVNTFFDVLLERWSTRLPQVSRSAQYFQQQAKENLREKIAEEYKGVRFKLVSEGEGRFDFELDENIMSTKEMRRANPSELTRIIEEFRKERFFRLYDAYKKEILPDAISKKSKKAKDAMIKKLREEENTVRSRLNLPRYTRGDDNLLEPHLSLYPTSDELLIKLYGEILKSKYEPHQQASEWVGHMVDFLCQRSVQKVFEHPDSLEVRVGGRELSLDDMLRASVLSFKEGKGSERILEKIMDPTEDNLFGGISADRYTSPQHCVHLGAFGKRRVVVIYSLTKLLGDKDMLAALSNILENGQYQLNEGGLTMQVQSSAIVALVGMSDELDEYPSIMQKVKPVIFPRKYAVSSGVLESFADMIHNNRRKGERPFAKSGIEMLARVIRAETNYPSQISAKFGLVARDAPDISLRVGEDEYVKDVDVIKYYEERLKGHELGNSHQVFYATNVAHHFFEDTPEGKRFKKIVGQAVCLGAYDRVSGMFFTEYAEPAVVNVAVSPGQGKMFSTGKGSLEGPLLEKGNVNMFAFLNKTLQHTFFDLALNFVDQDETDGWSASGAATVAALSALSGFPVDQRIAMTGYVHDFDGSVGPIGGIMEKVYWYNRASKVVSDMFHVPYEGFGIVTPAIDIDVFHMFRPILSEVEKEVRDGSYAVYYVNSIKEAVPIMLYAEDETGVRRKVTYEEVIEKAKERAKELSAISKELYH
jgi:hypothetical protein